MAQGFMNDLISRQAAITAIQNAYCDTEGGEDKCAVWKNVGLTNALHIMQDLPSAQPEIAEQTTETAQNVSDGDLISRKAAIEIASGFCHPANVAKELEALPSAQPERKRGKWIYGEDEYGIDGYHCDKCGFFVPWDYTHKFINYIEDYKFCPHCGAEMSKE